MKQLLGLCCVACLLVSPALAAKKKGMQFWNLTGETLSEVALAPVGSTTFGSNQCVNDKDGTVDFDENLAITGVEPGRYDVRMKDVKGRVCYARSVTVEADKTFSISEKEMTDCAK
ncbi:hypothetical protein LGH83_05350 [Lichenihabitans sp. PAMC28606]|uniref:hypothetical protein n=1 Tax=Lichenihabitans sp. PAMC28606 TaxID=2880932 RepID=UPI001D0B95E5|nr:hypothetical protein [Lichenihabitans sp. PAMC28606]UDL95643.1 hypothetical protein LGH83_05350 [Lichenihabitans sp. PAMC28606]